MPCKSLGIKFFCPKLHMTKTELPPDNTPPSAYEACRFYSLTPAVPKRLNHVFIVEFQEYERGPAFARIVIDIECNKYTQQWINAHPRFKRDCSPLVLFQLKDFLLQYKLVEVPAGAVKVIKGGVQDKRDERNETYFVIKLEILNDRILQNWLFPLANLANTHIDDQLSAFFARRPDCIPDVARTIKVLGDYGKLLQEDARVLAVEQAERFSKLSQCDGKKILFADESGDPGFKDWWSSYITAVSVIDEAKVDAVREALRKLLIEAWAPQEPPREMHFSKIDSVKRKQLAMGLSRLVVEYDIQLYCFEATKAHYLKYLLRCEAEYRKNEEYPVQTTITELPTNPKANVIFNFLALFVEEIVGHIGGELLSQGKNLLLCHDRKHRVWMNEAVAFGARRGGDLIRRQSEGIYGKPLAPHVEFELVDSELEPCLWFSDWIAGEMRAWAAGHDFSPGLEQCISNFVLIGYDEEGKKVATRRPGEPSFQIFDDIPRLIPMDEDAAPLAAEQGE